MPEAADQQQPEAEHPLHDLLEELARRMRLLGEHKQTFTGDHARSEFRDNAYPILYEIAEFMGDIDDRLSMLEADGATGIAPELSEAIIEGLERFGACLDIFTKSVPAESEDGAALAAHRAWYAASAGELIEDVRDAGTAGPEGDEQEEPENGPAA